ncbi:hypothetical protein QAD02_010030, partial [Eretmocerus hayati]
TAVPYRNNEGHPRDHHNHKVKSAPLYRSAKAREFDLSAFLRGTIPPLTPIWLAKLDLQTDSGCSYEKLELPVGPLLKGGFFVDEKKDTVVLGQFERRQSSFKGINGFGSEKRILNMTEQGFESDEYIRRLVDNIRLQVREMIGSRETYDKKMHVNDESVSKSQDTRIDTLYPELLLIIDYHLFRDFNHNIEEIVRYISTFWSIVDQIFAEIDSPQVQITITGLIIETEDNALDFLRLSQIGHDKAVITSMLSGIGQHFSSKLSTVKTFGHFDAAVLMTGLKLVGKKAVKYLGLAYVGGMCSKNCNAAVIFDNGNFHGIDTAAHELGHLMSMKHDLNNTCKDDFRLDFANKSSIMSSGLTKVKILWSKCSVKALQEYS